MSDEENKIVVASASVTDKPKKKQIFAQFNKLSKSQNRILIVALICGVLGGAFLFARAATTSYSLWPSNPIPSTITSISSTSVELGVKFKSSNSGYVTGIRFYKGAQNTEIGRASCRERV